MTEQEAADALAQQRIAAAQAAAVAAEAAATGDLNQWASTQPQQ